MYQFGGAKDKKLSANCDSGVVAALRSLVRGQSEALSAPGTGRPPSGRVGV